MSATDAVGRHAVKAPTARSNQACREPGTPSDIETGYCDRVGIDVLAFFQKLPPCLADIETWNNGAALPSE